MVAFSNCYCTFLTQEDHKGMRKKQGAEMDINSTTFTSSLYIHLVVSRIVAVAAADVTGGKWISTQSRQ